jgi:hypothetical protein
VVNVVIFVVNVVGEDELLLFSSKMRMHVDFFLPSICNHQNLFIFKSSQYGRECGRRENKKVRPRHVKIRCNLKDYKCTARVESVPSPSDHFSSRSARKLLLLRLRAR